MHCEKPFTNKFDYNLNCSLSYNAYPGFWCISCCQTPMINILHLCLRRSEVWSCVPTSHTSKIQICVFEMHHRPLLSRLHIYTNTNIGQHESDD